MNFLKSQYSYPNLNVLRVVLRYPDRSWTDLLNFQPTYRYSGKRRTKVTDFLLEASPEPDPTLPQINLIPLTAEQEMAKKRAVRALLTETNSPRCHQPVKLRRPRWHFHLINPHHLAKTSVPRLRQPSNALSMKMKPWFLRPPYQALH